MTTSETFWNETRTERGGGGDGGVSLYRGTLRDAKEGTTGVDIGTCWLAQEAERPKDDAAAQTEEVGVADEGSQAITRVSAATEVDQDLLQTIDIASTSKYAAAGEEEEQQQQVNLEDVPELVPFLTRVTPLMESELKSSEESTAFSFHRHATDGSNTTCDLRHILEPKLPSLSANTNANANANANASGSDRAREGERRKTAAKNPHRLVCTQLSWNATGYALAASYGRFDISGWCDVPGALCVWNLGTRRAAASNASAEASQGTSSSSSSSKSSGGSKKGGKGGRVRGAMPESTLSPLSPDVVIETDVCLQCCSCHPSHPALVAGGSYSGEVYVWNVSATEAFSTDAQVARSRITTKSHHDPVVAVAWHYSLSMEMESGRGGRGARGARGAAGKREETYQLVSLGMDGKVLVWQWHGGGTLDYPLFGYELVYANPKTHKIITWGGLCMSFQQQQQQQERGGGGGGRKGTSGGRTTTTTTDSSTFVVGTEGGGVFRCLIEDHHHRNQQEQDGSGPKSKYRSPIKSDFSPHAGMTCAVASSPFHRSLFLTAGSDSTIKVFNLLDRKPILQLEPTAPCLFSLSWSPVRPMVLAAGSGDGRVFFYDLATSRVHPVKVLPVHLLSSTTIDEEGGAGVGDGDDPDADGGGGGASRSRRRHHPVYSLQFNPKLHTYFATAYGDSVRIWELGVELTESPPGELQKIEELLMSKD